MTKMERLSADVLSAMTPAVERLKNSAAEHEGASRESRARVRRQRITSQQSFQEEPAKIEPTAEVPEQPLEMPASWRDDEPTVKTTLADDRKFEKK